MSMADFRYKGELPNSAVSALGVVQKFAIPMSDGSKAELVSPSPEGWKSGDVVTAPNDPRALAAMAADPRFEAV